MYLCVIVYIFFFSPRVVMSKLLDCGFDVNEFVVFSYYNVHFGTKPHVKSIYICYLPRYGLNLLLLFFYQDGFGIR